MEKDKSIEITMNGEKFIASRQNTSLFTFIGEMAVYDHVFIELEENSGAYLFKNQAVWHDLTSFMMDNAYPMHLHMNEVPECDRNAFDNTMYADIRQTESFPADW